MSQPESMPGSQMPSLSLPDLCDSMNLGLDGSLRLPLPPISSLEHQELLAGLGGSQTEPLMPVSQPDLFNLANAALPPQQQLDLGALIAPELATHAQHAGHHAGHHAGQRATAPRVPAASLIFISQDNLLELPHLLDKSAKQAIKAAHHSLSKAEHRYSRASRRGPMDDMRQLVRILVKLMPSSSSLLIEDAAGGGNRVSEEQIKNYLKRTIGQAPMPEWGCPNGWGSYLAELFSWALGREVTTDEAMRCARRQPGRSWEAVPEEMAKLGVYPAKWSLPLTLDGVQGVNMKRAARSASGQQARSEAADAGAEPDEGDSPSHSMHNAAETLAVLGGGREASTKSQSKMQMTYEEGTAQVPRTQAQQQAAKRRKQHSGLTATSSPMDVDPDQVVTVARERSVGMAGLPLAPPILAGFAPGFAAGAATAGEAGSPMPPGHVPYLDVGLLTVEQCWHTAARCLLSASARDDTAPAESHFRLAQLHELINASLKKDFKFLAARSAGAGASPRAVMPSPATAPGPAAARVEPRMSCLSAGMDLAGVKPLQLKSPQPQLERPAGVVPLPGSPLHQALLQGLLQSLQQAGASAASSSRQQAQQQAQQAQQQQQQQQQQSAKELARTSLLGSIERSAESPSKISAGAGVGAPALALSPNKAVSLLVNTLGKSGMPAAPGTAV